MFNRELLKGSTALIILQLLAEKDLYGYQLVKEMEQRSEYQLQVKEGTLYPALHKLEQNGYIVSYWQEQEKGPARKYYRLTSEGQQTLQEKNNGMDELCPNDQSGIKADVKKESLSYWNLLGDLVS